MNASAFRVLESPGWREVIAENASRTKFKPGLRSDIRDARLLIALGGAVPAAPSFDLRIEFLRSYETFGRARLDCVLRCSCASHELSAVGKAERVSVSTTFEGRITRRPARSEYTGTESATAAGQPLSAAWQCVVAITVIEPSFKLLSLAMSTPEG